MKRSICDMLSVSGEIESKYTGHAHLRSIQLLEYCDIHTHRENSRLVGSNFKPMNNMITSQEARKATYTTPPT